MILYQLDARISRYFGREAYFRESLKLVRLFSHHLALDGSFERVMKSVGEG